MKQKNKEKKSSKKMLKFTVDFLICVFPLSDLADKLSDDTQKLRISH